jgi:hypothetical protein
MRPSGVVSQVLLLKQQRAPSPPARAAIRASGSVLHVHLVVVISPDCAGIGPARGCVTVLVLTADKEAALLADREWRVLLDPAPTVRCLRKKDRQNQSDSRVIAFLGVNFRWVAWSSMNRRWGSTSAQASVNVRGDELHSAASCSSSGSFRDGNAR